VTLEAAVRREVIRQLRDSPVTGPLFHEAEKQVRPVAGKAAGQAYFEAVIYEAGLADIYADQVRRRLHQTRLEKTRPGGAR
jgi:hypothetical protein